MKAWIPSNLIVTQKLSSFLMLSYLDNPWDSSPFRPTMWWGLPLWQGPFPGQGGGHADVKLGHFSTGWVGPEGLCWSESELKGELRKEMTFQLAETKAHDLASACCIGYRWFAVAKDIKFWNAVLEPVLSSLWDTEAPDYREGGRTYWPLGVCLQRLISFRDKVFLPSRLVSEFLFLWKCLELFS